MRDFFLFLIINFTGIVSYKYFFNKNNKLTINSFTQTDNSYNTTSTQTDITIVEMQKMLQYKKEIDSINDGNKIYEWKFV